MMVKGFVNMDVWNWRPSAKLRYIIKQYGKANSTKFCRVSAEIGLNPTLPRSLLDLQWSEDQKRWCCKHENKACPAAPGCTKTPKPYDCAAGLGNWRAGWSMGKKHWCCDHENKGCPNSGDLNMAQVQDMGYGAGAQHGKRGAPLAPIR